MSENTFDDFNLKEELLRGIYTYGFEKPSAIQKKSIPVMISGKDIVAQGQSGTGKTLAFITGVLQNIDENSDNCQALILCHTRELAQQTHNIIKNIGDYMKVKVHTCVGGTSIKNDIHSIKNGVQVVVGTPGRIFDMINRNVINHLTLKLVVIDEADEMLSKGFIDQIYEIIKYVPETAQICLFSATLPQYILELSNKFMNEPEFILVKKDELTLEGIKQYYILVEDEQWKLNTICDLYNSISITQCIIYCNYKNKVDYLSEQMREQGFTVSSIHGSMEKDEREKIVSEFRSGVSRILISTDLLARGLDVQQVSLVINYDIPNNRENYIHRIGRSGRFGRKGTAINLVTSYDTQLLADIEEFYDTQIEELPANIDETLVKR